MVGQAVADWPEIAYRLAAVIERLMAEFDEMCRAPDCREEAEEALAAFGLKARTE
jgi:hypothetical protein